MEPTQQQQADHRMEDALEETGARDPRQYYRDMLRDLKARDAGAYEAAVEEYLAEVVEPIASGAVDPILTWLEFGCRLASRLHAGRTVIVDERGRTRAYEPPPSWSELILHLPENRKVRAIPVALPPDPTPAQRATLDLLALGKLRLPET
jgi:hypothetical protein